MIVATGFGSAIVKELIPLLPPSERPQRATLDDIPPNADRYLLCHGLLRPKATGLQTDAELAESFLVNCGTTIRACEMILDGNDKARICIVGSESAYTGSYDGGYAAAKAGLHSYVESKRLTYPAQQLVAVAPSIIGDAGMTLRRTDRHDVERRAQMHPKARLIKSIEVARLVHFLLYVDNGYLSGVVIRMNGGAHAW